MKKREFLKLGAGSVLVGATAPVLAASSGALSRAEYQVYLDKFNANDLSFIEYYHPNVELELGASKIVGDTGIRDFYANVKKYIKETVTVNEFVSDEHTIAVEIPTTFECIADWEDSFWGVPLKKGQVLRIVTFGFYRVEDRKFRYIKTARYKMVNDWRMEAA